MPKTLTTVGVSSFNCAQNEQPMSEATYDALNQAITDHIASEHSNQHFPAHWALVVGIDNLENYDNNETLIQVELSARTPSYITVGLLERGKHMYLGDEEI